MFVEGAVTISLSNEDLNELTKSLEPHAGIHPVPGVTNLALQVLKTEIKDRDGTVVEVVD